MTAIITKTLSSGKVLEIGIEQGKRHPKCVVVLDGKNLGKGDLHKPMEMPAGVPSHMTHLITLDSNRVPVTTEDAEILKAALEAARIAPDLGEQRRKLLTTLRNAEERQEKAVQRGHLSDGSAAHLAEQQHQPAVDAARQALKEFDAANPEVAAKATRTPSAEGFITRGLD